MANEVTINIESSLAAMAFVVADQQDTIKALREVNAEEHRVSKQYHDELCEMQQKYDDACNRLAQHEELHSAELIEKDAQIKNAKDDFDGAQYKCRKLEAQLADVENTMLNDLDWNPWVGEDLKMDIPYSNVSPHKSFPLIAILSDFKQFSSAPESPSDQKYDMTQPWLDIIYPSVDNEKQMMHVNYWKGDVIPRLYALIYPETLLTKQTHSVMARLAMAEVE